MDPHRLQAGNAVCPQGFIRGQENDRPDTALGFDREPVVYGFLPQVFHVFLEHLLFFSLVDVWPGSPRRMPVDGRRVGFMGCCGALR